MTLKTPEWYVNIKAAEWRTEPQLCVGSRVAFVADFLGRRLEYTYEVTGFVPNEYLVMRTAEGPFPMETRYVWSSTPDGGTHMTLRNIGNPAGFARFIAPFMGMAMRRATRKDLQLLKRILEAGDGVDAR